MPCTLFSKGWRYLIYDTFCSSATGDISWLEVKQRRGYIARDDQNLEDSLVALIEFKNSVGYNTSKSGILSDDFDIVSQLR
jgi:hypothetical protein